VVHPWNPIEQRVSANCAPARSAARGGNKDSYREPCASFSGANVDEGQPRFGP